MTTARSYGSNGTQGVRRRVERGREEFGEVRSDVQGFLNDATSLAQLELELAKAEMQESARAAAMTGAFGGATAVLMWITIAFAAVALMLGLDTFMPLWLAALVTLGVLVVLTAIAGVLTRAALKKVSVTPQRTVRSVREDIQWARNQLKLNAR